MDYLYSLYDALISINVPNDRARAVVDAMERDMGSTLATKADLHEHRLATKADVNELRHTMQADLNELRHAVQADLSEHRLATKAELNEMRLAAKSDVSELRHSMQADVGELRQEMRREFALDRQELALVRKDIEHVVTAVTVRLGTIVALALGLIFAALQLV